MPSSRCHWRHFLTQRPHRPLTHCCLEGDEAPSELSFRVTAANSIMPERFINLVARALRDCVSPYASAELLQQCRATVTGLNLATGGAGAASTEPVLLRPLSLEYVRACLQETQPWKVPDWPHYVFGPAGLGEEKQGSHQRAEDDCQYQESEKLADLLTAYLREGYHPGGVSKTLLKLTTWKYVE